MSAVAGLMRLDGEPAAARDLERMANTLAAYGPDRTSVALAGAVGFAHVLMRMTPEDWFDRQPLRGNAGELMTADLRLDNRDEILDRLSISRTESLNWPDSQILLAAWKKFGQDIWRLLRGPFAVAIWNPRDQTLTLARDHLGHNVVMWHKSDRFFAFATMPKGLFALADVPREVNEQKVADFLVLNHREYATTFYRDVYRLPPAHFATIDRTGAFVAKQYWSAADCKPVHLPSDEAYAENLRACLDRAVRRQLRSATPIGCSLCGGLDSSAVAALAARALGERGQRLAAFTAVPRKGFAGQVRRWGYTDETPYVEAIKAAISNIDVTYIYNDEHDDFAELDRVSLAFEYPVRNPTNLGWMLAILRLARADNRRVLLGGFLGNNTVSWDGWSQARRHLFRGRLRLAYRQYSAFYRVSTLSRWIAFRRLFVDSLWSPWRARAQSLLAGGARFHFDQAACRGGAEHRPSAGGRSARAEFRGRFCRPFLHRPACFLALPSAVERCDGTVACRRLARCARRRRLHHDCAGRPAAGAARARRHSVAQPLECPRLLLCSSRRAVGTAPVGELQSRRGHGGRRCGGGDRRAGAVASPDDREFHQSKTRKRRAVHSAGPLRHRDVAHAYRPATRVRQRLGPCGMVT